MDDIINEITKHWKGGICQYVGIGDSATTGEHDVNKTQADKELRRSVDNLMRMSLRRGCGQTMRTRDMVQSAAVMPLPDFHDRTHYAKEMIFGTSLLYNSSIQMASMSFQNYAKSFVYLDVSGSVDKCLAKIFAVLKPYCLRRQCVVFAFSTKVVPITRTNFVKNKVTTTGGTSISCVIQHLMSIPAGRLPHNVVLLTDGLTDYPSRKEIDFIKQQKVNVYCGLIGDARYVSEQYLNGIVKQFIKIPIES